MRTALLVVLLSAVVSARVVLKYRKNDGSKVTSKYVVYPGLDADIDEVDEWNIGYATPFNVFFGPKPYVIGWMGGEGPFFPDPTGEDVEDEDEEEEEEEEEDEKKKKPKNKLKSKK